MKLTPLQKSYNNLGAWKFKEENGQCHLVYNRKLVIIMMTITAVLVLALSTAAYFYLRNEKEAIFFPIVGGLTVFILIVIAFSIATNKKNAESLFVYDPKLNTAKIVNHSGIIENATDTLGFTYEKYASPGGSNVELNYVIDGDRTAFLSYISESGQINKVKDRLSGLGFTVIEYDDRNQAG